MFQWGGIDKAHLQQFKKRTGGEEVDKADITLLGICYVNGINSWMCNEVKGGIFSPWIGRHTSMAGYMLIHQSESNTVQEKEKIIAIATFLNRQESVGHLPQIGGTLINTFSFGCHHGLRDVISWPGNWIQDLNSKKAVLPIGLSGEFPWQILYKVIDASWSCPPLITLGSPATLVLLFLF